MDGETRFMISPLFTKDCAVRGFFMTFPFDFITVSALIGARDVIISGVYLNEVKAEYKYYHTPIFSKI